MQIQPVVLSGGSGSRLWPLSREAYPKQLLPLVNHHTLLQETVLRTRHLPDANAALVICNEQHRFIVANQLQQMGMQAASIILEPVGRNTAPAAAIAALHMCAQKQDSLLLIMPADHNIADSKLFADAVMAASLVAEQDYLVTFGITPTRPEAGYGYIQKAKTLIENGIYQVATFIEKPDMANAAQFVAAGDYCWNSGIFLFKASVYLQALQMYEPTIYADCVAAYQAHTQDTDFLRLPNEEFARCKSDSIDYAVLEKSEKIAVMPLMVGWSDVGSWDALHALGTQDVDGNILQGDVTTLGVKNSYIRAEDRMIAAIGIENHIIIETDDVVLVMHKDHCQNVKTLVSDLKQRGRSEYALHKKVYRPWGYYESLIDGHRFQVKRITVNAGQRLSMQMHHHRAEHWVVVSGTAKVTRDDEEFILTENQSTYISVGARHRLENPGKMPLEIIEVQSGSYLSEDDIVRFSDDYGRDI